MATKVRYVTSSSGVNVRSTAAGTKIVALNYGDLMYDIEGVANVTAALNGTSYVWVKVHYYTKDRPSKEGEGWVTVNNTAIVSTTVPIKQQVNSSNTVLKQSDRLTNARYIYKFLKDNGWSSNAIFAILGNMEAESYMSPGSWQEENNENLGYGLPHWSPVKDKYFKWLPSGAIRSDIDNQLKYILYEAKNNMQWDSRLHSPAMTYSEFTVSKKAVATLSEYFTRCYENCSNIDLEVSVRQKNAAKWNKLINYLI